MAELIVTDVNGKQSILNSKSKNCISEFEFSNRNDIQKIIIPEGIVIIEQSAFEDCPSLEEITLPQSLLEIGYKAFKGCLKLGEITLPTYLRCIGSEAFKSTGLKKISVRTSEIKNEPDVKEFCYHTIGYNAFDSCTDLTEIAIPDNIVQIGNHAFNNCTKLEKVTFSSSSSLLYIDSFCFSECTLKEAKLPEGLIKIGTCAFSYCPNLEEIVFPRSLKKIGYSAFASSGLKKVSISESTTEDIPKGNLLIEKEAFKNCEFLEEFSLPKGANVDFSILEGCSNLRHIFIER